MPNFGFSFLGKLLCAGDGGHASWGARLTKKEIATYRKVIDGNKAPTVTIAPDKVLTLTDALQLAVENEERLSIQGENYLQALTAKDQAFAAFLADRRHRWELGVPEWWRSFSTAFAGFCLKCAD